MQKVKFSVFSDIHIDEHWTSDGTDRLNAILARAKRENVDFIIDCGDFGYPSQIGRALDTYNNFEIPTYHVLGNHDLDKATLDEAVKAFNMPNEYYYFDKNGFRFIALNENYCRVDGEDIPYSMGNYFKMGEYRDYISKEQIEWLYDVVMSSPYPMVIFSHGSLQLEDIYGDAVKNREDVQNIFRKAHKNGKRILMCLNGHYHVDYMRIYEHVCYFDVNSATMYWMSNTHDKFGEEFHKKHIGACHTVIYNDPLSAIVTLSEDGSIEIEGTESSFYMGISKEDVSGNSCHNAIKCTPKIMSEKLRLPIEL
ncbi:MAG: hypothetical protein E7587_01505 [Ruminococcaceae bacterium]|nr:hypothetical protein [Oscillospiraceae bacterium]